MKYWNALTQVEEELIQLEMLLSNVKSLSCAIDSGLQVADIQNCIFMIEEKMEMITKNAGQSFQELWEDIRENECRDEFDESSFDNLTTNELTDIMNSWVKHA